jgi:aquaporin Z
MQALGNPPRQKKPPEPSTMKALLTEAIGTFFLVLTIGIVVNLDASLAPVAIGFALMVMVYAGGRISGAHYNPAVSFAAMLRGVLPSSKLAGYWGAQLAGGIAAAFLVYKFTGATLTVAPAQDSTILKVLAGEAVATFALVYVVLNVATSEATKGNSYFGLAIGATVMAMAIAFGGITGGAFNPAVGIAPAIVNAALGNGFGAMTWAYVAGPLAGATAGAFTFRYLDAA